MFEYYWNVRPIKLVTDKFCGNVFRITDTSVLYSLKWKREKIKRKFVVMLLYMVVQFYTVYQ